MPRSLPLACALVASLCGLPQPTVAQEAALSVELQWSILSNVLLFDRTFKTRAGAEVVVGIVYQSATRNSSRTKDEVARVLSSGVLEEALGIPVRHVLIEFTDGADLDGIVSKEEIDLLYVTPLRAVDIREITRVSRARQILTLTGVPEYVERGISLGLDERDGRPLILVNRRGASAEGAELSSELLKLARLINEEE